MNAPPNPADDPWNPADDPFPGSISMSAACPLCTGDGGELVWRGRRLRVILASEPDYPGFTRVVWSEHVAEMTGLTAADRRALMRAVFVVETVQREVLAPDKINLASFGNMVPHLHWHVIPRWRDDPHFPEPVWGRPAVGRDAEIAARRASVEARLPAYLDMLRTRLAQSQH